MEEQERAVCFLCWMLQVTLSKHGLHVKVPVMLRGSRLAQAGEGPTQEPAESQSSVSWSEAHAQIC